MRLRRGRVWYLPVFLTWRGLRGYNVDVTENCSMTFCLALRLEGSVDHGNRQDARECGESPLLPRNCERHCRADR